MDRDDVARPMVPGQEGLRAAPVTAPRHSGRRSGPPAVPDAPVSAWEAAYRRYGRISERPLSPSEIEADAALQMAYASQAVAHAWREIARSSSLPWWTLAAVESAAQAFEAQAHDWEARHRAIVSGSGVRGDE